MLPAGGPRGGETAIQIDGNNMAGARLHLSGKGLAVRNVQVSDSGGQLTAEIVATKDAWLGPHELRVTTPRGISNGGIFWVDVRPNKPVLPPMKEADPPRELQREPAGVINGRIPRAASRDRYVFTARAGEVWVFECAANRIGSRFDPVLELRDDGGRMVALEQGTWESDPILTFKALKSGRYFLTLRDSEFKGGPNFTYRLTAGVVPLVRRMLPLGGSPGSEVSLALSGPNLALVMAKSEIPARAQPGTFWVQIPADGPFAVRLLVDHTPVTCATESSTVAIPGLPANVDGVFEMRSTARLAFHAANKNPVLLDLLGRRIGSRIDGSLRVLDSSGKEIASNDDAIGKDARLEFAPPAAGDYALEVSNVEEKTGDDCYWRLTAREDEPDFTVELRTDRVHVPAGTTITLPVEVVRTGGYAGPIEVGADNLPKGVNAKPATIAPDKPKGEITLTAAADAPLNVSELHVFGAAKIGSKTVTHEARGWEQYEHRSIDQVLAKEYSYTRPHHVWDMLLIAVTENKPAFTVNVEPDEVALPPGGKCQFTIKVDRKGANPGVVKISYHNLPQGVTPSASEIPADKNEVRVTLTAAANAPAEIPYVIVSGTIGSASATSRPLRVAVVK